MVLWKKPRFGGRDRLERWAPRLAVLALPLLVLVSLGVMTALNLNGSSVDLLGTDYQNDPSLVAGTPRVIRSDEWAIGTPIVIGNVRRGGPVQPWVGLSPTYLPLTGIPSVHWTETFKPYDWGFAVLFPDRGFAFRWWSSLAIGLLGVYALVWLLTRSALIAAGLAAVVVFAPATAWWSDGPAVITGFMAGGTACALAGMTAKRTRSALAWGLTSGYLFAAGFLVLYPPWQVSLAWVCLAVIVGWALDTRARLARIATAGIAALTVLVTSIFLWYVQARDGILATAHTYYPGRRFSSAGGASLSWLLDAPVSLWLTSSHASVLQPSDRDFQGDLLTANPSEVSSTWLPLPLLAACAVVFGWMSWRAWRRRCSEPQPSSADTTGSAAPLSVLSAPGAGEGNRTYSDRPRLLWTGWSLTAVILLLLAWALLRLPRWFGTLTLLDRVPGPRTTVAIGTAAVLLIAVTARATRSRRLPRWLVGLLAIGAVGSVVAMVWAVKHLPWDQAHGVPKVAKVAVVAAVFTVGILLICHGRWAGTGAVISGLVAFAVFVPVNPLYRGLGPLDRDPLVKALLPYGRSDSPPRTAVYGDWKTVALTTASGVVNLSGLTFYPDAQVWQRLAPTQETIWNNFSKYEWVADTSLTQARIEVVQGTQRRLVINPCAPDTLALNIDLSVSTAPLKAPCLEPVETVQRPGGTVYLYRTK
jgi:hypothetical protein